MSEFPTPADLELAGKVAWAAYYEIVGRLLAVRPPALSLDALQMIRRDLRTGQWAPSGLPAGKEAQRAALLNDVAEAMIVGDPAMRVYYAGCGDLHPVAPDDPGGLVA